MTTGDRKFIRFIYTALAVVVILALVVDAALSPMKPPVPTPKPDTHPYYKELSWEAVIMYYLLGFLFYAFVMLMALIQDGTVQRLWFKWRWSMWQKYSRATLIGDGPDGWFARWVLRLYDPAKIRLDTFYQWLSEANEAFERGRLGEAVEAYRRAVALRPNSAVARVNLGAALGRLGRHEEALKQFRGVLEADGSNGDARKNAALALIEVGRPVEAYEQIAPHLAARSRDSEAWWIAARCRAADPSASPDQIAEPLRRACRLDPSRRAATAAEPAFSPFLEHPSIRELLLPAEIAP
jgi:tetratricopeptide (TPR) repeat protein